MFMRKPFTAEPIPDERVGVQVKLCNPLRTRAIPERFCGGDALRRGAISSVWTFTFIFIKFDAVTQCREEACFQGSVTLLPKGIGAPTVPILFFFLTFMRTPFVAELLNLTW